MFTRSFLASCIAAALFVQVSASAQDGIVYTEASDLTLVGKLMATPNPYHRVDTVAFKGFTKGENSQSASPPESPWHSGQTRPTSTS